jgi:hypothetical protein
MLESNKFNFELGRDYYMEKGEIIFTESYLIRRGKCCGSLCKYCPFWPTEKGNEILREEIIKRIKK